MRPPPAYGDKDITGLTFRCQNAYKEKVMRRPSGWMKPKRFYFEARLDFQAENIDDALLKLADYFKCRAEGKDDNLDSVGEIHINKESYRRGISYDR